MTASDHPTWRCQAACRGLGAVFTRAYSTGSGADAKRVCAPCPVVRACLVDAIDGREKAGVWGGVTVGDSNGWRVLTRAWRTRAHPTGLDCDDPGCAWCRAVDDHLTRLAEWAAAGGPRLPNPVDANGNDANCGHLSSYARGCRCSPCRFSATVAAARLRAHRVDVPAWWADQFGSLDAGDVDHAKKLAAQDLSFLYSDRRTG